jgi:Flp pilus assembly protein TadG
MSRLVRDFLKDRNGGPLVEFAIVLPFLLLMFLAIIALGVTFQRTQLLETASRDAARWLARVDDPDASVTAARNVAVFGNPAGTGAARLPGLTTGNVAIGFVDTANPIDGATGMREFAGPDPVRSVQVTIDYAFDGGGSMGALGFSGFSYRAEHEQRVIGD